MSKRGNLLNQTSLNRSKVQDRKPVNHRELMLSKGLNPNGIIVSNKLLAAIIKKETDY